MSFAPPLYQCARYATAVGCFFLLGRTLRSERQMDAVFRALLVAGLVTGVFSLTTSLPFTRPYANGVFSLPFVMGAGARALSESEATRGRSLVGSVNMTGALLCAMWPLLAWSSNRFRHMRRDSWRLLSRATLLIVPLGALATYSRGAWLSLLIVLCGGVLGGSSRRTSLGVAVLIAALGLWLGIESRQTRVDRIIETTEAAIYDRRASEEERLGSYSGVFEHLVEHPEFLFLGAGSAERKMSIRGEALELTFDRGAHDNHSAFAMSYYYFGLVGCGFLLGVFMAVGKRVLEASQRLRASRAGRGALTCVSLTWLSLVPYYLFNPSGAGEPRGTTVFLGVLGLVLAIVRFETPSLSTSSRGPYDPTNHATDRGA